MKTRLAGVVLLFLVAGVVPAAGGPISLFRGTVTDYASPPDTKTFWVAFAPQPGSAWGVGTYSHGSLDSWAASIYGSTMGLSSLLFGIAPDGMSVYFDNPHATSRVSVATSPSNPVIGLHGYYNESLLQCSRVLSSAPDSFVDVPAPAGLSWIWGEFLVNPDLIRPDVSGSARLRVEGGIIELTTVYTDPSPPPPSSVPDPGSTLLLFGIALSGLGAARRRLRN